jgi:predicted nucleic acid-binding Zn ribbon protein
MRYTLSVNRNMNRLGDVLETALRKLDLADAALEARAVMLWPQVVGPQMARASEAQKVQGGTLVVITRTSAWSQEFSFQKSHILRTYKERLGQEFIKDLRFVVGAVRGVADPLAGQGPSLSELRRIKLPAAEVTQIREASAASGDPELAQAIRRALTHEAQLRLWHLEHGAKECPRCGAAFRTSHAACPACRQDDATADAPL